MRLAGSHVLACNPLPGVGVLRGLTHLVARSNYGINRWVGWGGAWSGEGYSWHTLCLQATAGVIDEDEDAVCPVPLPVP